MCGCTRSQDGTYYTTQQIGVEPDASYSNLTVSAETLRGLNYGQEYFGTFFRAMFTMFQVLTGESWAEVVARPVLFGHPSDSNWPLTAFYFASYIVLMQIVLVNVVVAVLLDKFVVPPEQEGEHETDGEGESTSPIEHGRKHVWHDGRHDASGKGAGSSSSSSGGDASASASVLPSKPPKEGGVAAPGELVALRAEVAAIHAKLNGLSAMHSQLDGLTAAVAQLVAASGHPGVPKLPAIPRGGGVPPREAADDSEYAA